MAAITFAITIGIILSLQTAVNSRLRGFIGSPYQASFVSFTVGTLFLAVILLLNRQPLGISQHLLTTQPWWIWIGGLLGVIFLTTNILLFPHIGGIQTAIMPILGQVIMGVIIDNFGWFHSPQQSLTLIRLLGLLVALIGIIVTVALPEIIQAHVAPASNPNPAHGNPWPWRLLGIVTGALGATQTTINGRLGLALNSALHAAFISFLIGTLCLFLIVLLVHHNFRAIRQATGHGKPWWIWIGGAMGGIFVLGNAYLAPILGTGQTVVFALLGQIAGGLLVDQFGLLGAHHKPIVPVQFLGLFLLIGGVILIRLF
ncbi:DMT family transporter [Levilactobacillus fujinensis]|uniref:DMT family transporter n=1 Tax=Levilactobacillus fujinensis TaxID=2486024 RepID=A0ABW1TCU8_9LACO|nr:DMT family transporter [Levilactobacillus fujinensis]